MSSDVFGSSPETEIADRWAGTVFQEAGPEEQKAREPKLTVFMRCVKTWKLSADRS